MSTADYRAVIDDDDNVLEPDYLNAINPCRRDL
jgi:hypothetical protein